MMRTACLYLFSLCHEFQWPVGSSGTRHCSQAWKHRLHWGPEYAWRSFWRDVGSGNEFIQGWVKSFHGFIFITLLLEFMTLVIMRRSQTLPLSMGPQGSRSFQNDSVFEFWSSEIPIAVSSFSVLSKSGIKRASPKPRVYRFQQCS